ncbi:uncharacterized protein LOC126905697 isoform X2 [Daktulosphaira vitifoliae]|nr:uncharacterized protein LOC126905697 isoform X2 [Daktulosphaira vitifoliae]
MYAAAGGASLASRRHKHKQRNTADTDALIHQQFQRRFQQHQQQYAPASLDHLRASTSLVTPTTPISPFGQVKLQSPFELPENKTVGVASTAWPGPAGPSPDADLSAAPDRSILIHLPGDPHKKWRKKNKIHDTLSYGESAADRRLFELQQGAAANTLLYVGLCSVALGLIIAFVGTGEKGFKTVQLRFIGPGMIFIGMCCCALRIMLCFCPAFCFKRRRHKSMSDKMAEFYKYMPFRNHPMAAHNTSAVDNPAPAEVLPMVLLKPALKQSCARVDEQTQPQLYQVKQVPKATPEASLESSVENLIEHDEYLDTEDRSSSKNDLSSMKNSVTFENPLSMVSKMMTKSSEEFCNTSSTPDGDTIDYQELVLSPLNLTQ